MLFYARGNDACIETDAAVLHRLHDLFTQHRVKTPDHAILAHDDVYIATQGIEDAAEFDGDVAAAGNQDALRPFLERKEIVGYDTVTGSRDVGHHRPASRRDDDSPRAIMLIADGQRMRVDELRGTRNKVHAAPVQVFLVDTVEAGDVSIAARLQ